MTRRPAVLAGAGLALPLLLYVVLTQPFVGATASSVPSVDPRRLEAHVRALSERFVPRDYLHPEKLDRAAAYIAQELTAAGGRVTDQAFEARDTTYRNVVASFGPASQERVVIGAHYDTDGPLPGADDNASGVAGIIELGHLLGRSALATQIDLVAYSLEEPPFFRTNEMGSFVHAASLRAEGVELRGMIALEMIGCFTDEPGSQSFPLPGLSLLYPKVGNFIAIVGSFGDRGLVSDIKAAMKGATPLPVESISGPRWIPALDFSDHLNYWAHDYSAVMITDTAFYRNQRYHTEEDTPDTLDYERMAQVVRGVYAAALALGNE